MHPANAAAFAGSLAEARETGGDAAGAAAAKLDSMLANQRLAALAHVMPMASVPNDGTVVNAITRDGLRIVRVERMDGRFVGPDRSYDERDLFGWLTPSPEAEERAARADYHADEYDADRSLGHEVDA
ncbi:MAG: hypothetical protein KIS96_11415 [Bauldia sp.]|nr:hypothetical protein [Bauldia sp.]